MLETLDLPCSMHEVEVVLSGKDAGHMLSKKGVRYGTSSEGILCFSRRCSSCTPLGERILAAALHLEECHPVQRALFQAFSTVLRLCLLFLSFAKLFSFACILEVMERGMKESFFPKGEQVLCKMLPRQRWVTFLRKGEQGVCGEKWECSWRPGRTLGKEGRMFS